MARRLDRVQEQLSDSGRQRPRAKSVTAQGATTRAVATWDFDTASAEAQ